MNVRILL